MDNFKDQWNLEMAMEVLSSEAVDSATWAEAVKWLLIYGPPEIRVILEQAAGSANEKFFPKLKPTGYNEKGDPCFSVEDLADALSLESEEIFEQFSNMEEEYGVQQLFDNENVKKPN